MIRLPHRLGAGALAWLALWGGAAVAQEPTQPFTEADFDKHMKQVLERDAFPVLDDPPTVTVDKVLKRLSAYDMVIGVVQNGVARAYPIAVMGVHELVNDTVGGTPITVSW